MQTQSRKLSAERRRVLNLLQNLNFGRIEGLEVRGGEPCLDSSFNVIREYKFGGENGPQRVCSADDFLLKHQHVELFALFDQLGDGLILTLEVKHGLPFRALVSEPVTFT